MEHKALIFDIKRDSSEDGPGIRSTVFFKGCPLSCVWCQNPEGMSMHQETDLEGEPLGEWIELEELLYRVRQDRKFYRSSGGGVTLSGGEPTRQMEFNHYFLKALKADGIHTAIETCGLFNYTRFQQQLLPWLDLIYFDLKLVDDFQSRRYTGCSNRLIMKNFSSLVASAEVPIVPRIPLIPGITDTEHNLRGLARFLRENGVGKCSLMPYNPMWQDKLKRMGKTSNYSRCTFLSPEEKQASLRFFQRP
ncbi:Pyruvate formate-lyase activating enzyme [hydrothermal vent metagenome]|uniref:Pyruvate formate-lyase activating enzyme n=1 Tax=hydrothermal vent metagenome TaxID=652676 RepID=A0A3B0WRH8_9ZZZZ